MKYNPLIVAACALHVFVSSSAHSQDQKAHAPSAEKPSITHMQSGQYLASRFAQSSHDWKSANQFVQELINEETSSAELLERSMVLSIGADNMSKAIETAKVVKVENPDNILADIVLLVDAFKRKDYETLTQIQKSFPKTSTGQFVSPLINGWIEAAHGNLNVDNLQSNTIQLHHAILISDYLEDYSEIEKIIDKTIKVKNIGTNDLYRIADLYGHVGLKDKALNLYEKIKKALPDNPQIDEKIAAIKNGTQKPLLESISNVDHGMARAFHDIATLVHEQQNNESARLFAHIALYLNPDITVTKFLLADINEEYDQIEQSVTYLSTIAQSDPKYIEAQHNIADIYISQERFKDAEKLLKRLINTHHDISTVINIGDLHRQQSNYGLALKYYDAAIEKLNGKVPEEYWHLHYVRGIAYEQSNNWSRAEEELKTALSFRPQNPYILNYLGYAWADQGVNLQESLAMIQKASDLRPMDGYITDSLGWVLYRKKQYHEATKVLERAVELLPYDPTINDHLGDAYWQVGRHLEARFQWERAKNHSNDSEQIEAMKAKIISGLKPEKISSK